VKNSSAAGRGSTPAEEALMPQPLPVEKREEQAAAAEAAAGDGSEEEELVEMPEDYLRWLLAQTRETDPVPTLADYRTRDPKVLERLQEEIEWLQASQDEFFEFQASVREKLEKNELVIVPAVAAGPTDQFQQAIEEYWYGLLKEYDYAGCKTEVAQPLN